MGKFFLWFILPILVVISYGYYTYQTTGYAFGLDRTIFSKGTINITTQRFMNGGQIPAENTCDGRDLSPAFIFDRIPDYAKSVVLVMDDADSNPKYFTHWIAFNINQYTTSIDSSKYLGEAVVGTNDYGNQEYDGPCPPVGETHKYYFRIFALDIVLTLDETAKRSDLDAAMKGHIIANGEIYGIYTRVAN